MLKTWITYTMCITHYITTQQFWRLVTILEICNVFIDDVHLIIWQEDVKLYCFEMWQEQCQKHHSFVCFSYNYDNYDKRIARTFVMSFMSQNWGTRFFPAQPAHARWAGNKQNNPLHTSYRWVWLGYVHPKNCINWYAHKRSILTKVMENNYVGRK